MAKQFLPHEKVPDQLLASIRANVTPPPFDPETARLERELREAADAVRGIGPKAGASA